MKKILFLLIIVSVYGCKTEGDVEPANEKTFIRYMGTGLNNAAVLAMETAGGYSLLSNAESDDRNTRKIKFIQADQYGHTLWERNYPESGEERWSASSFIEISDANSGYLIIGESIKSNDATDLLLLRIDNQGNQVGNPAIIPAPNLTTSLHGRAVTIDPTDGNYIILGNITSDPAPTKDDIYLYKISAQDFTVMWSVVYGAGVSTTVSRIYSFNNNQELLWGGSVINSFSNKNDVRLIKAPMGAPGSITGGPIGDPDFDESALDLCESFGGWAFTGSTSQHDTTGIFVMKVTSGSQPIFLSTMEGLKGVSITPTGDGGVAVLGEVSTEFKSEDLKIAKVNASGKILWEHNYGGADKQEAASIRETSDGSYLVFGTTYFVNEKKLMLMKVNGNGKL
jgi:hypothetical protein